LFLFPDIGGAIFSVADGIDIEFELSVVEGGIEEFAEKWDAPAASRSSTSAFADLAGHTRLVNANVVDDFSLGDMEAVAEFVVAGHGVPGDDWRVVWGGGILS
jgi:hypothetical protein